MMHTTKQKLKFIAATAEAWQITVYPTVWDFLSGTENNIRIHHSEGQYWKGDAPPAEIRIYASDFFDGNFVVARLKTSYTTLLGDTQQYFYRVQALKDDCGLVTNLSFEEVCFEVTPVACGLPSEPERCC